MSLTFEPFADTAEYVDVNKRIVESWVRAMMQRGVDGIDRLVDIATGAGTMVHLFMETLPDHWRSPAVTCLDSSKEALDLARARLEAVVAGSLSFVRSSVQKMPADLEKADVVVFGNGIHYLDRDDQSEALKNIREVLNRGGWFFFNTAFYEESRPANTLPFYRKKVKLAVQSLRKMGVVRDKEASRPAAGEFLPRRHYEQILRDAGFEIVLAEEIGARLGCEAWQHISGYSQYAEGALHGFPAEEAADALQKAVAPALDEHGEQEAGAAPYVTRNWLALAAVRV